ncbi:23S rRNA (cytidine1920-2'-O)/16S rRNA (cytidine1409-2'-O)-methyltransferase [Virgibacillus natechei]|uniref:23S rRNA (Cytidine1920-2'-O)/16S rRNA (Cytidine1409-2'-O)-methyltransferase n=1 Tax=Virgibacillus natechei TaxID=1216297 RepID=A0ABS4IFI3_9BACI|nr:TlyA family RNA methyltransferase [Virgibacillus natechei]MBP1969703.1 23S rRNA (cytidine1920-2'-O)/16S rRNA (cytidine1409-2'-O)-methyltransferase [Virgibacillus natechei]UZD11428.1 TlyA family RNA methyltransferase [Virgibacillus natechei]
MTKKRLDELLVDKNLIETNDKAKRIIMAGLVFSEQNRLDKPGMKVDESIPITIKGRSIPYVGRGGLKLKKALNHFSITATGKTMLDVGSSTGGFTDCALQNGALLSYAVDVGYNQLDWKLRNDDRVIVMERTNFRYVTPDMLRHGTPNLASIDVSFISLKLILPVLKNLLTPNGDVIALIKPQFEAHRDEVGNKGIVRDKRVHQRVLKKIIEFATDEQYELYDLTHSPITGGDGNIEFLVYLGWKKPNRGRIITDQELEQKVDEAHGELNSIARK